MEELHPLKILANLSEEAFQQTHPYNELMMRYNCAMLEIKTKLDVLNNQLSLEDDSNPFESRKAETQRISINC